MIRRMLVLLAVACLLGACSSNETPADGSSPEETLSTGSGQAPDLASGAQAPVDSGNGETAEVPTAEVQSQDETATADEPAEDPADEAGSDEVPSIEEIAFVRDVSPDMTPAGGLRVIRAYVCKGIEQSEPTEAGKSFVPEDGVLRLCCFSEIAGAEGPDTVLHIWRWGEREMARVVLEVKSNHWRTWSTKRILDEWRGEWHVDITESDGTLLTRLDFSVE